MPTLQQIVNAGQIAAYWNTQDKTAFMTEELFPANKQLGLNLKWIKGSNGMPVVLKPSAFDASAVPRPRIGATLFQDEMPYFKESIYIDEEMRQQLNIVLMTGQQGLIDGVVASVFKDEIRLIQAASARREQMRCMLLTSGGITIAGNGQSFLFDYNMPAANKVTVATAWSSASADVVGDIMTGISYIQSTTGMRPGRALCDGKSWANLRNNPAIRSAVFITGSTMVSDRTLRTYLADEFGLDVIVNDLRYTDNTGTTSKYVPDNTFVMFPLGALGTTWFGTTPAESDLMTGNVADVAIVDTGVAVTTAQKVDPVQVETIVSQICLPSFEMCDSTYILTTSV